MGQQLHKRLAKGFVEEVLDGFNERRLTEERACELLGLKRARFYRLRKQWLRDSRRGQEFSLWNRKESRFHAFPEEVEDWLHQELTYIRSEAEVYRGRFNFAFLAELAEKEFQRTFQRNSLRLFALRHGYYHALPEEKEKVYTRFEVSGPGVLFQHDSSHHRWLPSTGKWDALVLTIDDYSRRVLGARIVEAETTWEHLVLTKEIMGRYGRPLAYYVDNHSIFRYVGYTSRHYQYLKGPDEGEIQFKRALKSLDVGLIYTGKGEAQAKGKVEKRFDYIQRRVPYLCEKHHVTKIKEAHPILEDVVGYYNDRREHQETGEIPSQRWEKAIREGKGKLRPLESSADLEVTFSLHLQRRVKKDGTISFRGKEYRIGRFAGQTVTVCLIPQAKIMIVKDHVKIGEYHL